MFLAQLVAELAAAIHTLQKNTRTTKKQRKKERIPLDYSEISSQFLTYDVVVVVWLKRDITNKILGYNKSYTFFSLNEDCLTFCNYMILRITLRLHKNLCGLFFFSFFFLWFFFCSTYAEYEDFVSCVLQLCLVFSCLAAVQNFSFPLNVCGTNFMMFLSLYPDFLFFF